MSETNLKRCPFCGESLVNIPPSKIFYHENNGCLLSLKGFTSEDFDKWNTRKPMDDIVERLEGLVEKYMGNSEKAAELGKKYERHMILNGAKGMALEEAIAIVKGEV